jgi:hypothetical protein
MSYFDENYRFNLNNTEGYNQSQLSFLNAKFDEIYADVEEEDIKYFQEKLLREFDSGKYDDEFDTIN